MRGRRKTVKISEAEWSIMKVLWDGCARAGRGLTLGEIAADLSGVTGWSNTTIRTLIIRLAEKDAVGIDRTAGVYKYTPNTSKEDCVRSEVDAFVKRVFDGSAYELIANVAREAVFTDEEKRALTELLR